MYVSCYLFCFVVNEETCKDRFKMIVLIAIHMRQGLWSRVYEIVFAIVEKCRTVETTH